MLDQKTFDVIWMYYKDRKLPKLQIAKQLNIRPDEVTRYIDEAFDRKLLRLEFGGELKYYTDVVVGGKLRDLYNLTECRATVAPSFSARMGRKEDIKECVAKAAASYLLERRILQDKISIGVTCGTTLYQMIQNLNLEGRRFEGITVYPLHAYMREKLQMDLLDSNSLAVALYAKLNSPESCTLYQLPSIIQNKRLQETTLEEIEKTMNDYKQKYNLDEFEEEICKNLNVLLLGIGSFGSGSAPHVKIRLDDAGVSEETLNKLGVVGEINFFPFNESGEPVVSDEIDKYTKSIWGLSLKRIKELAALREQQNRSKGSRRIDVIAVACGMDKFKAIKVALEAKLCNILITDIKVAGELIKKKTESNV